MPVNVALVDSGVSATAAQNVATSKCFCTERERFARGCLLDNIGHGGPLSDIIVRLAPRCKILNARIFERRLATSTRALARAIDWSVAMNAHIVNLSVGVRTSSPPLREACARAVDIGVIIVAASPARGDLTFPASYKGVVSVTGDARCDPGEISALQNDRADFGASPRGCDEADEKNGGASYSAAWVTGMLARFLEEFPDANRERAIARLIAESRYHGAERRPL
ncbi:MAG: S8 family serine peptidase [Amphiplicatus sp.]